MVLDLKKLQRNFLDNFLFRVLVPDYNTKKGKNIFLGSQNRKIRKILNANGLEKCVFKKFSPFENNSCTFIT